MVWHFIGVYIINRTLHDRLEIRNFSSRVEKYFTRSLRSLVKYFSTLEEKFRISARPCNILYFSTDRNILNLQKILDHFCPLWLSICYQVFRYCFLSFSFLFFWGGGGGGGAEGGPKGGPEGGPNIKMHVSRQTQTDFCFFFNPSVFAG